jgi:hypothetical protein
MKESRKGRGKYWFEVLFNIRSHLSPTLANFLYAPFQHSRGWELSLGRKNIGGALTPTCSHPCYAFVCNLYSVGRWIKVCILRWSLSVTSNKNVRNITRVESGLSAYSTLNWTKIRHTAIRVLTNARSFEANCVMNMGMFSSCKTF